MFLFSQHVRLLSPDRLDDGPAEEKEGNESQSSKLDALVASIEKYSAALGFDMPTDSKCESESAHGPIREHPLVAAFLEFVEQGTWKPCQLPLMDIHAPEYIELATGTYLFGLSFHWEIMLSS